MSIKNKLFIFLSLLIIAGAALFVYNFFIQEQTATNQNNSPTPKESFDLKPITVSKEAVLAPTASEDGQNIKYYLANNGHALRSDPEGKSATEISSTDLPGLIKIIWSPDKTKVISFIENQAGSQKGVFDFQNRRFAQLNADIKDIAWSPDSQKIAYQFQNKDGSLNNISFANFDGSNWKVLFNTRLDDLTIQWPSPNKISFISKTSGTIPGSLLTIDTETSALNTILSNAYGLDILWSPDGQKIIYQETDQNGKNLKLFITRLDSPEAKELPIATLTKKCVWSADSLNIFCAVPQKLSENVIWPDDYLAGLLALKDDLYLVDTSILKKIKIAQSNDNASFDMRDLFLSPQENYLFFTNQKNGPLYGVKLEISPRTMN